jgi:hypothetical protein
LQGVVKGLNSVVQNIGALRTHQGDAHGKGTAEIAIEYDAAEFAVLAAGNCSTFLMRRFTAWRKAHKPG